MMSVIATTDASLITQNLMSGSHIAHLIRATVDIALAGSLIIPMLGETLKCAVQCSNYLMWRGKHENVW